MKTETGRRHFGLWPAQEAPGGRRKNRAALLLCAGVTALLILLVNLLPYTPYTSTSYGSTMDYEIAKVLEVTQEDLEDSLHQEGLMVGSQTLSVKLLTGSHKGETVTAQNALSTYSSVVAKAGMRLTVLVDALDSGAFQVRVYNYYRLPYIALMVGLFFAALVLVGGRKGIMSGVGLVYTFVCVFAIFLPLVLRGYSPVWSAVLLVVLVSAVTMLLLNGLSIKSLCGALGTVLGVLLSAVVMLGFARLMHLSGFSTDEAESLLLIAQTSGLQVQNLLYGGILIVSLGAIMDIAMSVVSAMSEVRAHSPQVSAGTLFRAGMNVGKDVIGTMSNTLILVFAGTALNLLILLASYSVQFNQYMNMNTVAIEITQAISGSLAVVLTVPGTALLTALLLGRTRPMQKEK